ncbi:MAG: IPT/TIG domain-containing protein, partial [Acidimicrobiales bacterium]
SDTQITAVAPAQAAGNRNVFVTTAGGTSPTVTADLFSYKAPVPAVTGLSPASGTTLGGTVVTITGSGFTAASSVRFGPVAATSFTVVSDTQITAVAPAQAAGSRNVFVTTAGGTSSTVTADLFSYQ